MLSRTTLLESVPNIGFSPCLWGFRAWSARNQSYPNLCPSVSLFEPQKCNNCHKDFLVSSGALSSRSSREKCNKLSHDIGDAAQPRGIDPNETRQGIKRNHGHNYRSAATANVIPLLIRGHRDYRREESSALPLGEGGSHTGCPHRQGKYVRPNGASRVAGK